MHTVLHVVLMIAFLGGIAGAFLMLALPLILDVPRRTTLKIPILTGVAALASFAVDWLIHRS